MKTRPTLDSLRTHSDSRAKSRLTRVAAVLRLGSRASGAARTRRRDVHRPDVTTQRKGLRGVVTQDSRLPTEPLTALPARSHMHAARSLNAWALFRYAVPSTCAGVCVRRSCRLEHGALSGLTGLRAWARDRLVLINVGDHFHVVECSELAMDHFHLVILLGHEGGVRVGRAA